jgi:hypothetical protein
MSSATQMIISENFPIILFKAKSFTALHILIYDSIYCVLKQKMI